MIKLTFLHRYLIYFAFLCRTTRQLMADVRIVFMGTPEFAVPSLEILIRNKFDVVAVVTAPDKPQGRGLKLAFSPVKECALRHHLPVLQPARLKSPEFIEELRSYDAQLQVVVAFRMLPEAVWSMPAIGTFNLHASLLPQYRGAAPVNWAIINGEKETGVTTFFLQHEIDTGSVIFQDKELIRDDDTAGALHERLMHRGAELVLKTVRGISEGKYNSIPQPKDVISKPAPKIFRETSEIDWSQPGEQVRNFVRGLSPYPAAWTTINGRIYKILRVSNVHHPVPGDPAAFVTDDRKYLYFKTADGWVSIDELQAEGKRRMTVGDFFRGNRL